MQTKTAIRKQVLAALAALPADQKKIQSQQLIDGLVGSSVWQSAKVIGLTMSTDIELDTRPLIAQALAAGKTVTIPRTLPHRQMEMVAFGPGVSFEQTKFGVDEPVGGQVVDGNDHDLLVVPGVAFSDEGSRVGFGAGYYDRYLANYNGATISLALAPQRFTKPAWVTEEFDVKIQQVIALLED